MKLYATTTSERASKGQGGNKFLDTEFFVGSTNRSELAGVVKMETIENNVTKITISFQCIGDDIVKYVDEWGNLIEKGNNQKGERVCAKCISKNFDNQGICLSCGHR